ncbi:unnamed protein product [Linum tenue]|uniref:Uncharacterized protein n=1 Tax=Linum tenue TaxID=586396 RepID=A0AAV0PVX9_9ROSI|nr:unnamed protein product [Linum tenue]
MLRKKMQVFMKAKQMMQSWSELVDLQDEEDSRETRFGLEDDSLYGKRFEPSSGTRCRFV